MSERRGPKALELWCRRITEGYPGVNVQNMTTSWRDGLAFCAMIHHFRPDLIDFNSLNKDDVYGNNEMAFRTAEQHLGIPALLDAEDMASCAVPDRLSILTYLSQFYQQFGGSSPSRVALSRTAENKSQGIPPVPESQPSKVVTRLGMRREPCSVCGMPVFLAEKLVISRTTYHRTCFRCARCRAQLTPGNYYETEDGQFCCETCPDEDVTATTPISNEPESYEDSKPIEEVDNPEENSAIALGYERSLSDEEKCIKQGQVNVARSDDVLSKQIAEIADMRHNFMSSHLLGTSTNISSHRVSNSGEVPDDNQLTSSDNIDNVENNSKDNLISHSMTPSTVNNLEDTEINDSIHKRCLTATNNIDVIKDDLSKTSQDTKDTLGVVDKVNDDDASPEDDLNFPPVRRRLQVFENWSAYANENYANPSDMFMEPDSLEIVDSCNENFVATVNTGMMQDPSIVKLLEDSSNDGIDILNATEIDLSGGKESYPDENNPFKSDEEDDVINNEKERDFKKASTNPFGSDSEDNDECERKDAQSVTPVPAVRNKFGTHEQSPKRLLEAPKINLNPFWSDDEEPDSENDIRQEVTMPIPKPRTRNLQRDDFYNSNSSLASSSSATTHSGSHYKKRPAPPPPIAQAQSSPLKTPKPRKSRRAPLPPPLASTPDHLSLANLTLNESPLNESSKMMNEEDEMWEDTKLSKNETNKTRQSMCAESPDERANYLYHDKSAHGKWKRKKAPAPARPTPQRRKIHVMSMREATTELNQIEMQQQGLEKQGVRLEQLIREKCECGDQDDKSSLSNDADELVLDLFALVNEKNELFRRQAELMLLKRQHRLEEEHADVEYQIRCLMYQPEATKTDFDKQREEALIQRLVEIVQMRSEIVECMEMDRRREVEEDKSINMHMEMYTAKNKGDRMDNTDQPIQLHKSKKTKLKEKFKEKNFKKSHKKDADKDVDETEVKLKRQNKKKWF